MLVTSLIVAARVVLQSPDTLTPAAHRALDALRYLAADAREGRAVGTRGKTIGNLYDMTDALRSHQAGDTVLIVVKRDTTVLRFTAVLGKGS